MKGRRGESGSFGGRSCSQVFLVFVVCAIVCLVDDSFSLPPDFFRVGRPSHLPSYSPQSSANWKRTGPGGSFGGMRLFPVSDDDVVAVVCNYCASLAGQSLASACQSNHQDTRRACTEAFLKDVRALLLPPDNN